MPSPQFYITQKRATMTRSRSWSLLSYFLSFLIVSITLLNALVDAAKKKKPSEIAAEEAAAKEAAEAAAAAAASSSQMNAFIIAAGFTTVVSGFVGVLYIFVFFAEKKKLLPLNDFLAVPLIRKEVLSHDTRRFTFQLPKPDMSLGLPIGQHLTLRFTDSQGKTVQRSYTPITLDDTKGEFQLVIKVYKPLPPKFPAGGAMSQHLDALNIGDTILIKGPKGHLDWKGGATGQFEVKPLGKPLETRSCDCIGMIAGGTGITPMLQILKAIFASTSTSDVCVKLLYANQTPDDILVQDELEALAKQHGNRFQVWYTVDRFQNDDQKGTWKYDTGFISKSMVENRLLFDDKKKNIQFFMCGPPPMMKFACLPALQELGYAEKDWVVF